MLLELRQLSQSFATAGVTVERWDKMIADYPRGAAYEVQLAENGQIASIRVRPREFTAQLHLFRESDGGLQESIPGFRVPPLYDLPEATPDFPKQVTDFAKGKNALGETEESRRITIDAFIALARQGWSGAIKKVEACLGRSATALRRSIQGADEKKAELLRPLLELLRRISLLTPEGLREGILRAVRSSLESGLREEREAFVKLLFRRKRKTKTRDPDAVTLFLELANWSGNPANHPTVWKTLNEVILQTAVSPPARHNTDSEKDVFGTNCGEADLQPIRGVVVKKLGQVKLRSHRRDKECQYRYGLIEAASCPVSAETVAQLRDSLKWVTHQDREGKTFWDVSDSCGYPLPALLLAYPDPLPTQPPALAAVLAKTGQQGLTPVHARFEAAAEVVIGQLEDLKAKTPSARVNIFVLAKRDAARTKLLLSRQFMADRIIQAARDWRLAAANTPPVLIRQFRQDRQPQLTQCDQVPFPTEVARCLNRTWQRGGERVESVAVFDFGAALTLFLDDGRLLAETASEALRLAISQWLPLLQAMGQECCLGRVCAFSPGEQVLLPVILGLLLFKLGHRKGDYMSDMPYWIGCLLALADRFHRNYCDLQRERKYPPQLIGNATLSACLENPQAGLARLAERLPLYQQVAGKELRREAAEVTHHIDPTKLPDRATDLHKAQILLGYLARPDLLERPTQDEEKC